MVVASYGRSVLGLSVCLRWYRVSFVVAEMYGRCAKAKVGLEHSGMLSMVLPFASCDGYV